MNLATAAVTASAEQGAVSGAPAVGHAPSLWVLIAVATLVVIGLTAVTTTAPTTSGRAGSDRAAARGAATLLLLTAVALGALVTLRG